MTSKSLKFISIHPSFLESYFQFGVFRRAIEAGTLACRATQLRDYAVDKHGSVDDRPYGGGDGMVLRPEPLRDAVLNARPGRVIHFSPAGKAWTQTDAKRLAMSSEPVIFVCARFGGPDQRFIDNYVDEEFSFGDFVISGGELPALIAADSIVRHLPGALGNASSLDCDSFGSGLDGQLEYPLYTRPLEFEGQTVPEVLIGGHHEKITRWKAKNSSEKTEELRPDLKVKPKVN